MAGSKSQMRFCRNFSACELPFCSKVPTPHPLPLHPSDDLRVYWPLNREVLCSWPLTFYVSVFMSEKIVKLWHLTLSPACVWSCSVKTGGHWEHRSIRWHPFLSGLIVTHWSTLTCRENLRNAIFKWIVKTVIKAVSDCNEIPISFMSI